MRLKTDQDAGMSGWLQIISDWLQMVEIQDFLMLEINS